MSADKTEAEEAIAKTLRLRAPPPQVARLSRRTLTVVGVLLAIGLTSALGWSLMERRKPAQEEPKALSPPVPSERVTALPRGYVGTAGVPKLGPPLPGDLGRPMLRAAEAGRDTGWPAAERREPVAQPTRYRQAMDPSSEVPAVRQDGRASSLFIAVAERKSPSDGRSGAVAVGPIVDARTTSVERLQPAASPYILQAGAVIPAALVTGLRSDVPGLAIAQVTQDVFDSLGGGVLLIPAGARLIGDYDARVAAGASRLAVVWTRLILPSGRSIVLDKLPAADAQGMAGLEDGVERHGRRVIAAAGLSTLLAIGAEAGSSSEDSDLVRAVRRGAGDTVSDVGRQMVGKSLDLAPTLTIRPGAPLRVLLTRDLVLEPFEERKAP